MQEKYNRKKQIFESVLTTMMFNEINLKLILWCNAQNFMTKHLLFIAWFPFRRTLDTRVFKKCRFCIVSCSIQNRHFYEHPNRHPTKISKKLSHEKQIFVFSNKWNRFLSKILYFKSLMWMIRFFQRANSGAQLWFKSFSFWISAPRDTFF